MAATTDEIGDFHGLEPPDLLEAAFLCAKSGREAEAGRIYDYVATLRPKRQMRAYWPLALTCPGAIGEEWATPALKRADLHINYLQETQAAEILNGIASPEHRAQVLIGRARLALANNAGAEALALAKQAGKIAPLSSYAAIILGTAQLAAGRPQDAIAPLTAAAAAGRAGAHFILGLAWQRLEKPEEAAAAYQQGYAFDAEDFGPANNLFAALLENRDYLAALAHADRHLARRPGHTTSLAYKYIALGELGRRSEIETLADPATLLKSERLSVPAGYADINVFHSALAREIAAEPTLTYERNTTRFGHQTDDIGFSATPAIQRLNAVLMEAVRRRAEAARASPSHPFHRAVPRDFRLYSWGVILREKGYQAQHFHPHGWLSGVYYIDVPDDITATDPTRSGWLEFGRGDERWNRKTTPMPILQLRPETGMLHTFPSYFWHNTRPLKSTKARISFAFDVIPLDG
ncbi:MAG: putative 2OG-Fe(II) oxygenase [Rhodospirillaceae bacterium]